MTALAKVEAAALAEHESAIEAERDGFVDRTSSHLLAIRDGRLYRAEFPTFEDYCQQRWGLTRQHVNRVIQHARVVAELEPTGSTPTNEAQARELAPLLDQPERLRETWDQVNQQTGGKPTAAAIRSVVRPPVPEGLTKVTNTTETYIDSATAEVIDHLPIAEHPDYQDEPRWQPRPPSPEAERARNEEISAQAWSQNLARWTTPLARMALARDHVEPYAAKFLPEYAAAYGGVSRQTLQDAARFLLALADVWKDEAA